MWLFTLPQILIQERMNKQREYIVVTSCVQLCSSPETGHLIVECTLSMYANVHVLQAHSCIHCQNSIGTRMYVLFTYEQKWMHIPICLTEQKMTEQRVKADTYLYVGEWLLHTLSCQ